MKHILIVLLAAILFSISCSQHKKNGANVIVDAKYDDTLKAEVLPEYIRSKGPVGVYYSPEGLLSVTGSRNGIIQLLDTTDGHAIFKKIMEGKGPNELLDPVANGYNKSYHAFSVYDNGKKQIINYLTSDTGVSLMNRVDIGNLNVASIQCISDSTSCILTSMPDQSLLLIDNDGKVISGLPYNILPDKGIDNSMYYYPSVIDVSLKNQMVVAADLHLPSISLYSFKDNKMVQLWQKMVFKPHYIIKKNWRWVIPDKNRGGFEWLSVTDKYIYVIYYGITSGDHDKLLFQDLNEITLLIFDYEGNMVKCLLLDQNVMTFTVTPDDRVLYGVIEKPDRLIVKYKLK